jgi:aryl-alcohol dehydrogenase-like predicted oxidoreductase
VEPGSRLALGTAQLSGHYGIANQTGQPSDTELLRLLDLARTSGVQTIDTAAAYGDAESTLGRVGTAGFSLITKLAPGTKPPEVADAVEGSLARLGRSSLSGLLVHHVEPPGAVELIAAMREESRVDRVGVSVYQPDQVERLLDLGVPLDVVQAPISALDQRFGPLLENLRAAGTEVHARSVFLQGLPFADESRLSGRLMPALPVLRRLREIARDADVPLAALLLRFVAEQPGVTQIVVGVETVGQLEANLEAFQTPVGRETLDELRELAIHDEDILLPQRWG